MCVCVCVYVRCTVHVCVRCTLRACAMRAHRLRLEAPTNRPMEAPIISLEAHTGTVPMELPQAPKFHCPNGTSFSQSLAQSFHWRLLMELSQWNFQKLLIFTAPLELHSRDGTSRAPIIGSMAVPMAVHWEFPSSNHWLHGCPNGLHCPNGTSLSQ